MKYLQSWMVDRIADKINVALINKPSKKALRRASTVAGSYIAMRTIYGRQQHWPLDKTGIDIDIYDDNPKSYYFLALKRCAFCRKKLLSGMRLTQVNDFNKSLSLSMWSNAIDKQSFTQQLVKHKQDIMLLKKSAKRSNVWDLTRLVTAMSLKDKRTAKDKRNTYVALLLSLGAALKFTGPDALWIFTCNQDIIRFLNRLGIQFTIVAKGRIGYSDSGDSYLGWTSAQAAYDQLKSGQHIVAHIAERGFADGAMTQSGSISVS